jgi:hypothetical protein
MTSHQHDTDKVIFTSCNRNRNFTVMYNILRNE